MHIHNNQNGFTFIGLMIIITISGIALSGIGIVWKQQSQREREVELLFIGNQYRKALESYYNNPPAPLTIKEYPKSLQDLVSDKRGLKVKHHLRKLYADPITYGKPWLLVMNNNQIVGIHSASNKIPIKKLGFAKVDENFADAKTYSDWIFSINGSNPINQDR